jgi:hypothetical protein
VHSARTLSHDKLEAASELGACHRWRRHNQEHLLKGHLVCLMAWINYNYIQFTRLYVYTARVCKMTSQEATAGRLVDG